MFLLQSFVSGDLICEISTLKAYNQTILRKNPKISLKNLKFIGDSVKQIKKYGYRVKNRSYLRICLAKLGFLDVNNEKCPFLTQEKTTSVTSWCSGRLIGLRDKGPEFKTRSRPLTFTKADTNFRTLHVVGFSLR